jgi:hypothetical protein
MRRDLNYAKHATTSIGPERADRTDADRGHEA